MLDMLMISLNYSVADIDTVNEFEKLDNNIHDDRKLTLKTELYYW